MRNARIPTKPPNYLLLLLFALAAFIRFYKLGEKQLWVDEIIQVIHSTPHRIIDLLLGVTKDRGAAPLDYLIQHFFIAGLGSSEVTARLHAAIFGSLTVIAIYFLVRKIFDEKVAFLTTFLYAVYPLHHHYSQEGRPYALFTFLTVCSYIAFLYALQKNKLLNWLCYGAITLLLLYSNYYAVFVMLSQFVFICLLLVPKGRGSFFLERPVTLRLMVGFVITATLALICFAPWVVFGIDTISGYQPAPEVFGWDLFARFIKEVGDRSYPLSLLLISLAVIGVRSLTLGSQFDNLLLLLCWCLLPLPLIFLLLWTKEYFFAIRQILFMTPALYVLVAVGILQSAEIVTRNRQHLKTKAVAFLTACVVIISGLVIWLHIPDRNPDLRSTAYFLQRNVQPEARVAAPNISGILGYYFPEINDYAIDSADLPEVRPGQIVYVVESPYMTELDRMSVMQATQDQNHEIVQTWDFREIRIIKLQNR